MRAFFIALPLFLAQARSPHTWSSASEVSPDSSGQQALLYFASWNVFSFHPSSHSFPDPLLPVWGDQHAHSNEIILLNELLPYLFEVLVVFVLVTALFFTHLLPHVHTHTPSLSPGFIFEVATPPLFFFFFKLSPSCLVTALFPVFDGNGIGRGERDNV